MKALTSMKSVMALVMGMALFAGCDQSKEELDKTKVELAKATAERDLMKGQIDKATQDAKDAQTKLTLSLIHIYEAVRFRPLRFHSVQCASA